MTLEVHNITWRGVEIEIVYAEKKFGVIDHVELRTEGKAPLPVTETGYRSEYFALGTAKEYGGVIPLVTAWLDHEAERVKWQGSQLSLF